MKLSETQYFADLIAVAMQLEGVKKKLSEIKDDCVRNADYEEAAFFRNHAGVVDVVLEEMEEEIYGTEAVNKKRAPGQARS